jgi:hypothetical protein
LKTVKTVAGSSVAGLKDGNPFEAQFMSPRGLAVLDGNVLVADTNRNSIRQLTFDSKGKVTKVETVVARERLWLEDPATKVQLSSPHSLAVDDSENIIIVADTLGIHLLSADLTQVFGPVPWPEGITHVHEPDLNPCFALHNGNVYAAVYKDIYIMGTTKAGMTPRRILEEMPDIASGLTEEVKFKL